MPLALMLQLCGSALAQTDRDALERLEQQRSQRQQRDASAMAPMAPTDALASKGTLAWQPPVAGESPCFTVHRLTWVEPSEPLPFGLRVLLNKLPGYEGACLGLESLKRLQANLDARLLEAGYLTSRVLLPAQNLTDGVLRVQVELGRIGRVVHRRADGSERPMPERLAPWMSFRAGDVLNLRDIEQSLENAARLPSLAAQVAIEPGDAPGLSNLVLLHTDAKTWRARLSTDNQALGDFGRWQAAVSASLDLGLLGADQISLWHQRSANGFTPAQRQQRANLSYSTALGAQLISLNLGQGEHRRRLQGTTLEFGEAARDHSVQLQVQRVLWRTGSWRASAVLGLEGRQARSFVEDTELLLQRRRSRAWDWGLDGQWRLGSWSATAQLRRQKVLDNDPRIDLLPEAPPKPRHDSLQLGMQRAAQAMPLQYETSAEWRWVQQPAYGADLLSLGGPASVRGFDGTQQLVGLRSAVWRHDLLWAPAWLQGKAGLSQQLSLGLDLGQVGDLDPSLRSPSPTRRLVGVAAAWRASWPQHGLSATLNWAKPLRQPSDWPTPSSRWTYEFSASI